MEEYEGLMGPIALALQDNRQCLQGTRVAIFKKDK